MGRRHSAHELLSAASRVVERDGLTGVTFGTVAREAGTNDRTVVYYFPDKPALLTAVLRGHVDALQTLLADAFTGAPLPPRALASRAWPVVTTAEADRIFAVFFELAGLASAGRAPFADLAASLTAQLVTWLEGLLAVDGDARVAAHGLIASLDGALLLRRLGGPEAGDRAAEAFGWTRR